MFYIVSLRDYDWPNCTTSLYIHLLQMLKAFIWLLFWKWNQFPEKRTELITKQRLQLAWPYDVISCSVCSLFYIWLHQGDCLTIICTDTERAVFKLIIHHCYIINPMFCYYSSSSQPERFKNKLIIHMFNFIICLVHLWLVIYNNVWNKYEEGFCNSFS